MRKTNQLLLPSSNLYLYFVVFLFFCIYSSISLINHYFLRTYALDYGLFNHAVYQFSRFEVNSCTNCFREMNYFGDHFSPITFVLIPFQLLFGSYGILVAQILFVLFGGIGFYKYVLLLSKDEKMSLWFLVFFYSFLGFFTALAFDYHNNVLAAILVPWLFYTIEKRKTVLFVLVWFLILCCKETMGLWMGFVMLGLLFLQNGKYRKSHKWLFIVLAILSFVHFYLITFKVMPYFQGERILSGLDRYKALGSSFKEIVTTMITEPKKVLAVILDDDHFNYGLKRETVFVSLLFGGWAAFFRPAYLLMLLPLFAQKFLAGEVNFWGVYAHYFVEIGPIVLLAVFEVIQSRKRSPLFKRRVVAGMAIIGFFFTTHFVNASSPIKEHYMGERASFLRKKHYVAPWDSKRIKNVIDEIPDHVSVSATTQLSPRLYKREKIYSFPISRDTDYIVLMKKGNTYPISTEQLLVYIEDYKNNPDYLTIENDDEIAVFKKLK